MQIRVEHVAANGKAGGWRVIVHETSSGIFADWNSAISFAFIILTVEAKGAELVIKTEPTA